MHKAYRPKKSTAMLGLCAATLLAACAGKSTQAEPTPLKQIAEVEVQGEELWSRDLGSLRGQNGLQPLLAASRVFFGDNKGRIQALDADGKTLWEVKTDRRLSAGPALADGALVFGTNDGEVIAFNAVDGSERWQAELSSEVVGAPAGDRDLVVVRTGDGRINALSPADGSRLWTVERTIPTLTLRGAGRVVMNSEAVFLGLDNGRLLALRRSDGQAYWEIPVSLPTGRSELERLVDVDAELLLVDNVLFAVSYGGDLVAVQANTGSIIWQRSLSSYTGMSYDEQCLYVTDTDAVLWCLEPSSGAAIWQQDQLKYRWLSAPLAYQGNVLVADYDGYVHAVSSANGKIIGRTRSGKETVKVPMQQRDGRFYVLNKGGKLFVMQMQPAGEQG